MKILVISLLRIGDLMLHSSVIKGLQKKYPDCEIHFLINDTSLGLGPLLPQVTKFHIVDRKNLQAAMTQYERNIWEPMDRLGHLVGELNNESFDLCINLTQTKFSGWMASLVEAVDRIGLSFNDFGKAQFHSPWFRYLNDFVAGGASECFHFVDIFNHALGIRGENPQLNLIETASGQVAARAKLAQCKVAGAFIVIQALTSDPKKDWGLKKFSSCLKDFHQRHPDFDIVLLGAEFEVDKIEELQGHCEREGIQVKVILGNLELALSLLKRAELLVTGDTSIKHLAATAGCKVIEVCVGSSNYVATGIYMDKALIIKAQADCFPCRHSEACTQDRFICKDSVPHELVAEAMSIVIEDRWPEFYASRFDRYRAMIVKTELGPCGYWVAESFQVGECNEAIYLNRLLKSGQKLQLQGELKNLVGEYGMEGLRLAKWNANSISGLKNSCQWLDSTGVSIEAAKEGLKKMKQQLLSQNNSLQQLCETVDALDGVVGSWGESKVQKTFSEELARLEKVENPNNVRSLSFNRQRRVDMFISSYSDRGEINYRIFRALKNHTLEDL